jgi:hypothetical protein
MQPKALRFLYFCGLDQSTNSVCDIAADAGLSLQGGSVFQIVEKLLTISIVLQ